MGETAAMVTVISFAAAAATISPGMDAHGAARELKYLVRKGRIGFYHGRRGPTFGPHHLAAYLESIEQCPSAPAKSAITGSAPIPGPASSAAPGTISDLDRQGAHRLAQQMFRPRATPMKPPSGSQHG